MPTELETFHNELFQEVLNKAESEGALTDEAFFDVFSEKLMEEGDLLTADKAFYSRPGKNNRIEKVNGYGGDPNDSSDKSLSLIICDFDQSPEVLTLTRTNINAEFTRLRNFVDSALDQEFRNRMEETDPAFGLADLISARWGDIDKIRMILLTNKVLSNRVDRIDSGLIESIPVSYSVLDLTRMQRLASASEEREEMNIDLLSDFGGGISALPANLENAEYESYLAVLPAEKLAAIYDRWSDRLLEQNVRVFLQARSNINRGIRNTLQNDPGMFFAYNNGITATAESVQTRQGPLGLEIIALENFQIVNGGQTTGSIYAASKAAWDLSNVFVQMKLSIIRAEKTNEIVPKISEYANSQNRVNPADFFANHPFHVRIEEFSRRILVPAIGTSLRQSKWFYERARGQYQDAIGNRTAGAQRREFGLDFPKNKKFVKTDLAKFVSVWDGDPHIVSRGAQKNFVSFAAEVGKKWDSNANQFNEMYYRHSIAKAIIFHDTEKLVSAQPWYETGGYRANIVAYAISKLALDVKKRSGVIDFERVWRDQSTFPELQQTLAVSATAVKDIIMNPSGYGSRNISEWAKQEACWKRVESLEISWPDSLDSCLLTREEQRDDSRSAQKDQKELNGIESQTAVVTAPPNFWASVTDWGTVGRFLSGDDVEVLKVAIDFPENPTRIPTERQSQRILEVLKRLQKEGCPIELNKDQM